jgi:Skp family chaperone for outer membrane proteins
MKTHLFLAASITAASFWGVSCAFGQAAGTAPSRHGTSVAVIDVSHVLKNHQRFKQTMDGIKKEIEAFEQRLQDDRATIASKSDQLKELGVGSARYKALEEEIARLHTQFRLETSRKRKEILEREASVFHNAYREIEEQVTAFANQYGIDLVLRFQSESVDPTKRESVYREVNRGVVFQRKLDITQHILDELNRPDRLTRRTQTPRARSGARLE